MTDTVDLTNDTLRGTLAIDELEEFLGQGEEIEIVAFGLFKGQHSSMTYTPDVENPAKIPPVMFGKPMSLKQATPYLEKFSLYSDYGEPETYPIWVWTNFRIIFTVCYDGSTHIGAVPRYSSMLSDNLFNLGLPKMFGG